MTAWKPALENKADVCPRLLLVVLPCDSPALVGPWRAVVMLWVPFCVMALMGSWCWPMGACCTMVTVCRGVADWELWMMRLEALTEVGAVSTLTEKRSRNTKTLFNRDNNNKLKPLLLSKLGKANHVNAAACGVCCRFPAPLRLWLCRRPTLLCDRLEKEA